jgi:hypothetical protein
MFIMTDKPLDIVVVVGAVGGEMARISVFVVVLDRLNVGVYVLSA